MKRIETPQRSADRVDFFSGAEEEEGGWEGQCAEWVGRGCGSVGVEGRR